MKRSKKLSVQPKIIPSYLHSDNNGACDWGHHGYIAYGCKTHVVVVDPSTVEVIQTLDSHKDNVVKVKWQQQNFYHSQTAGRTYSLIVASADKKGSVIIWDVVSGKMRSEFTGGQRIQEMDWYPGMEESHELLVTLHGGNTLSLWETYTGVRLWKKEFSENLSSFCLDPFDVHQLARACQQGHGKVMKLSYFGTSLSKLYRQQEYANVPLNPIHPPKNLKLSSNGIEAAVIGFRVLSENNQLLLLPDLNSKRPPSDNFQTIQFMANVSTPKQDDDPKNGGKDSSDVMNAYTMARIVKRASWNKLTSLADNIQNLFGADIGLNRRQVQPEENRECIQMVFNSSRIHQLFIVFPSKILLLDIDMKLVLNSTRLDPLSSALVKIFPCKWTEALYCFHTNGCVTLRMKRSYARTKSGKSETSKETDVTFDIVAQSDSLKLMRQAKIFGFICHPVSERTIAVITSDGRIYLLDVSARESENLPRAKKENTLKFSLQDLIRYLPAARVGETHSYNMMRFILSGMLQGLLSPITALKMQPSFKYFTNQSRAGSGNTNLCLAAIGSTWGCIQLLDITSGQIVKEFSLFSTPIRDIEWLDKERLITFTYPNPSSYSGIRNNIVILNTRTGEVDIFREAGKQNSPIESLSVSPSGQTFLIMYGNRCVEVWNIDSRRLIKEMDPSVVIPTSVVFYPEVVIDGTTTSTSKSGKKQTTEEVVTREIIFMLTSSDSMFLLKFCMQNNMIGEHFNPFTLQDLLGPNAKSIDVIQQCWKGSFAIFGTSDGILLLLDIVAKKLRRIVERPGLRILRLSFAPGRKAARFFVLCENEIGVWKIEKKEAKICSTMMSPRDIPRIVKAEWINREYLLLATDEGDIYITKWNKRKWVTHIGAHTISESTCRPHLLTPYSAMTLKLRLLCSPYHRESDTVYIEKLAMISGMELDILTRTETAERCYNVARLFGDDHDMNFWRLAMIYIQKKSHQREEFTGMNLHQRAERELQPKEDKTKLLEVTDQRTLETCFGILRDNESFTAEERKRLKVLSEKRQSKVHKDQCVRRAVMLGKLQLALQLLVENDINNDTFLTDYLTACLISSDRSSIESMTTIKMVSTHLMSIGQLDDGIQLLCLIDKSLDACKYLQSYGHWYRSVWLAKATLSADECKEVLTNWANHLWEENEKSKAILVMLSAGDVWRVIRMLTELGRFDTAALFIEACMEKVVIKKNMTGQENNGLALKATLHQFADLLIKLELKEAAEYYSNLV